mgnify:CR=1 FL=1
MKQENSDVLKRYQAVKQPKTADVESPPHINQKLLIL